MRLRAIASRVATGPNPLKSRATKSARSDRARIFTHRHDRRHDEDDRAQWQLVSSTRSRSSIAFACSVTRPHDGQASSRFNITYGESCTSPRFPCSARRCSPTYVTWQSCSRRSTFTCQELRQRCRTVREGCGILFRSFAECVFPALSRELDLTSSVFAGATEAVDVAIPPVLSEAALALANEDLPTVLARAASNTSLAAAGPSPSAASDSFGPLYLPPAAHQPGWQSPSLTYALEQAEHAGSPSSSSALDSPPSGGWDRVGSPATSPEPPLLEAKLAAACVSEPPNTASPLSSAPNSPRSLSPAPMLTVMPFPGSAANNATMTVSPGGSPQQMSKGSMSSDGLRDRRRLSFLSYADLISVYRPSC